jgi:hypothetical protein
MSDDRKGHRHVGPRNKKPARSGPPGAVCLQNLAADLPPLHAHLAESGAEESDGGGGMAAGAISEILARNASTFPGALVPYPTIQRVGLSGTRIRAYVQKRHKESASHL